MMRQNKNLLDINIDALYNILKQNQGDVNDAIKSEKKEVVITSDPLTLVAEQKKVSKRKEKVIVSSESEGSDDELKMITALLAKAFNRKKFYTKPTNNNLRTSSATSSANKKQESMKNDDKKEEKKVDKKKRYMRKVKCYNCKKEGHFAKDCKKAKVKDYEYYKTKMLLIKKDKDEQMEKGSFRFQKSSSSSDDTIAEVSYYTSESESEAEYETLEYYDNSTNYGLFVNNEDDQEIFHDLTTSSANKKQESMKNDDKKEEKKVDKKKRDMSKVKCYNCKKEGHFVKDCKKAKVKDYEYYKTKMLLIKKDKDEQVLLAEDHAWMESNSNSDQEIIANMVFMAQMEKVLSDSRKVHHLQMTPLLRKQIADQEILFDKMHRQLVELDENVRMLQNKVLEKDLKISVGPLT
nr:hypothetical protein [Tanacetum cinerariifolium]